MNLVHHLVVAEMLRERLLWPASLRGQMLLGAIVPDAHTEVAGLGRAHLHPAPGEDAVAMVLARIAPAHCLSRRPGRAFAVSCVGHLVADELTRTHTYHLPAHAPTGFLQVDRLEEHDLRPVFDMERLARSLMRAEVVCTLAPLRADALDHKRWELLGRHPLTGGRGTFVVVEPLATVARRCAEEALMRLYASDQGAELLGGWRIIA